MNESTLEIDSVLLNYKEKPILSDIYLKCGVGEVVGIVGRNGCGKSSLLKIIFGTLKSQNQSIRINGDLRQDLYLKKNLIKYLPQEGLLSPSFCVKRAMHLFVTDKNKLKRIKDDELIRKKLNQKVNSLSGGEKRYFEILLLLFSEAKFVLLDEPFTNLSPIQIDFVVAAIKLQKSSKGIIITDHNYNHVLSISTSVFLLHKGKTQHIKDKQTLFDSGYLPQPNKNCVKINKEHSLMDPINRLQIDKQTLNDLEIFDVSGSKQSIFKLFDFTETSGGRVRLQELLSKPKSDLEEIKVVQEVLKYLTTNITSWETNVSRADADLAEKYITTNLAPIERKGKSAALLEGLWYKTFYSSDYQYFQAGLKNLFNFLKELKILCAVNKDIVLPYFLQTYLIRIERLVKKDSIKKFLASDSLSYIDVFYYDKVFRTDLKQAVLDLFETYYELDALSALAKAVTQYNLTFPEFIENEKSQLSIEKLYHPFLTNPVHNDVLYNEAKNFMFLTGPNMAGKTTFMKACGIAVYLAHVGMGVPAKKMQLGVYDSVFSSININDNLSLGYSYYFSEVKRVKDVAIKLNKREKIFVMFDELFKGTNVKDAFEGSKLIISGFCQWNDSTFILSSHLTELEKEIKVFENVMFNYFNSKIENNKPKFDYLLMEGLSDERLGLLILENENILKLLNSKTLEEDLKLSK